VTVVASNIARALDAVGEKLGRVLTPDDVEPMTWAIAEIGRATPVANYLAMIEWTHRFGRRMAAWWQSGFDLLLTPTAAEPPPRIGEFASSPEIPLKPFLRAAPFGAFTFPINLTGQPAISLPFHWTASGLPVGAMLVAPYGREDAAAGGVGLEAAHPGAIAPAGFRLTATPSGESGANGWAERGMRRRRGGCAMASLRTSSSIARPLSARAQLSHRRLHQNETTALVPEHARLLPVSHRSKARCGGGAGRRAGVDETVVRDPRRHRER
jgi:hypothetical protein